MRQGLQHRRAEGDTPPNPSTRPEARERAESALEPAPDARTLIAAGQAHGRYCGATRPVLPSSTNGSTPTQDPCGADAVVTCTLTAYGAPHIYTTEHAPWYLQRVLSTPPHTTEHAPWYLQRVLLTPLVNSGSRYRCGKSS